MDASVIQNTVFAFGGKTETNGADQIFFTRPAVTGTSYRVPGTINRRSTTVPMPCYDLDHSHEYRMVDVDKAVRKALAEGKTEISRVYRRRPSGNQYYDFMPADSKQSLGC